MTVDQVFQLFGLCAVTGPVLLSAVLGGAALAGIRLSERRSARLTGAVTGIGLVASVAVLALMLVTGHRQVPIEIGDWVTIPDQHFRFHIKFVFDRLSVPVLILSYGLCGIVSAFAGRYLHREPASHRFFVLYAVFLTGMTVSVLAGTIETLFFGWELVGLSSALLVACFLDRVNPVRNGLRVWAVYRIADAAFLIAALMLHHLTGAGEFSGLMGSGAWPEGQASVTESQAIVIGLLLLFAAAGKSALVPFSGWLPRAMEGPTPSSAIFYGALSVHLGAYLLLRVSPLLEVSWLLQAAVVGVGLATATFAALAAGVQTDIKSALAFASLTQVGIIVMEIGVGLRYLALIHLIGHACLRTLQLLRASSLLHDYHALENAVGGHLPRSVMPLLRLLPQRLQPWLYRVSMERGFLDAMLTEFTVRPLTVLFRRCDRLERRWTDLLSGEPSPESGAPQRHTESLEEFV